MLIARARIFLRCALSYCEMATLPTRPRRISSWCSNQWIKNGQRKLLAHRVTIEGWSVWIRLLITMCLVAPVNGVDGLIFLLTGGFPCSDSNFSLWIEKQMANRSLVGIRWISLSPLSNKELIIDIESNYDFINLLRQIEIASIRAGPHSISTQQRQLEYNKVQNPDIQRSWLFGENRAHLPKSLKDKTEFLTTC